MMNFVSKMMDFVLKMMNFGRPILLLIGIDEVTATLSQRYMYCKQIAIQIINQMPFLN